MPPSISTNLHLELCQPSHKLQALRALCCEAFIFFKSSATSSLPWKPKLLSFPAVLGGAWLQSHSLEPEMMLPLGTVVPLFVHSVTCVFPCKDQSGKPRDKGSAQSIIKHTGKIQVQSVAAPGVLCLAGSVSKLSLMGTMRGVSIQQAAILPWEWHMPLR